MLYFIGFNYQKGFRNDHKVTGKNIKKVEKDIKMKIRQGQLKPLMPIEYKYKDFRLDMEKYPDYVSWKYKR